MITGPDIAAVAPDSADQFFLKTESRAADTLVVDEDEAESCSMSAMPTTTWAVIEHGEGIGDGQATSGSRRSRGYPPSATISAEAQVLFALAPTRRPAMGGTCGSAGDLAVLDDGERTRADAADRRSAMSAWPALVDDEGDGRRLRHRGGAARRQDFA